MQFGLVLNWHMPVGASGGLGIPTFDEQIRLAEGLGFTSVWPLKRDQVQGDVPVTWPQELMAKIAAATQTMSVNDTSEWALAGKLGVGVVASTPADAALQSRLDAYRHAVGRSAPGTGAGDQIAVSTLAICSATGGSDVRVYQGVCWPHRRRPPTEDVIAAAGTRRTPRTAFDRPVSGGTRIRGGDALARAGLLIGDAARCIEAARAYEKVGVSRLLCHFPVRAAAYAATTDAMTRFALDVIAAFA